MTKSSVIWVTGVTGFIGINLARSVADIGAKVIGFGNREQGGINLDLGCLTAYYSGGLVPESLEQAVKSHGVPEKIYHLAGGATVGGSFSDPYGDFEKNVVSSARILNFMQAQAPKAILYISSSAAIFGDGYQGEITTNDALNPLSPYGAHKVAVENMAKIYARTYDLKISIVRLFSVYGRELKKQLLWDACSRLKAGETPLRLGGSGQERRDWCHITDIVRYFQTVPAPERGQLQIKNAGSSIVTTVETLAALLVKYWPEPVSATFSGERRAGDPFSLLCAPDSNFSFDWSMSVEDGVADYVDWFQSLDH